MCMVRIARQNALEGSCSDVIASDSDAVGHSIFFKCNESLGRAFTVKTLLSFFVYLSILG